MKYTPSVAQDLDGNDTGRLGNTTIGRISCSIRKHAVRQQVLTMGWRQQYRRSGYRDYDGAMKSVEG